MMYMEYVLIALSVAGLMAFIGIIFLGIFEFVSEIIRKRKESHTKKMEVSGMESKNKPRIWVRIVKYAFVFFAIAIGLIILSAITKALFAYGIYAFFLGKVSTTFGLDLVPARLIAIFLAIASLLALPSIISFLFFGRRKKEVLIIISAAAAICFMSMYYGTANVFFDRNTGAPIKYYVKTLEGFKFSSSGDFDPMFGVRFKPITPEIIKEYYFWQDTGKLKNIPEIKAGKYFDMITGEPIVWYSERANGEITLFSLPGYDPMSGQLLKPITPEVVKRRQDEIGRKKKEDEFIAKKEQDEIKRKRIKDEFINRFKNGEINEDWYFNIKENAFWLESEKESMGRKEYLFFGEWEKGFDFFAEKIIFIPPNFTIIGICFQGTKKEIVGGIGSIYVLDSRGIKYKPIRYAGTNIDNNGDLWINLNKAEEKRVFLVLNYIPLEKFKRGGITWENGIIRFSIKWQ